MSCPYCAAFAGMSRHCPACHPESVYVESRDRRGKGHGLAQQRKEKRIKSLTARAKRAESALAKVWRKAGALLGD